MEKFPSIEQFRNVVSKVARRAGYVGQDENDQPIYNSIIKKPTLKFRGTIKLHGTNAGIVSYPDNPMIQYQSRERVLTLDADNAGFMSHMATNNRGFNLIKAMLSLLQVEKEEEKTLAIYGEWCGGNIQANVAITGLPKMFVVVAVKYGDDWQDMEKLKNIHENTELVFNIMQFPSWELEIDFDQPAEAQNKLVELTIAVETECPCGKFFGKSGIGEGIVWMCLNSEWNNQDFWFKVKGEKHSASKVKTLAEVDVVIAKAITEFVDRTVTVQRLEQGLQNLTNEQQKQFEITSIGDFIRWVFNDIIKEEADVIAASGFDQKKLGSPITIAAKRWYLEKLNQSAFIK